MRHLVTRSPGVLALLAGGLLAAAVLLALARIGLLQDAGSVRLGADWALTDFYSAAYQPARAVLEGSTPYARDGTYPPYAPLHLLVHAPFALLPPWAAGAAYLTGTVLLTLVLAYLALRLSEVRPAPHLVVLVAALVLLSRPGHWTLLLGQVSILLAVATYLVVLAGPGRPLLGGAALAVVMLKPTYGVVLAVLLWAWGWGRTVAWGALLAAVVNLPLLALLAAREGGVSALLAAAAGGYRSWQDLPDVNPATSSTRTDATSLVSRFLGEPLPDGGQIALSLGIMLAAALILRMVRRRDDELQGVALAVICLAINLVGFHRGYDLVLLAAPLTGLVVGTPAVPAAVRRLMFGLFALLALNWAATESVLAAWQPARPMWLLVTSASTVALLTLLVSYAWVALSSGRQPVAAAVASKPAW